LRIERELRLAIPFKPNAEYEDALSRQATEVAGQGGQSPTAQMMGAPGVAMGMVGGPMGGMIVNPPVTIELPGAVVESVSAVHVLETRLRLKKLIVGPQEVLNFEPLREEWTRYP